MTFVGVTTSRGDFPKYVAIPGTTFINQVSIYRYYLDFLEHYILRPIHCPVAARCALRQYHEYDTKGNERSWKDIEQAPLTWCIVLTPCSSEAEWERFEPLEWVNATSHCDLGAKAL